MGTRNTLGDLNNHLFEQMERLNGNDLEKEDLMEEIERSKAVVGVAKTIIENGSLVLAAHKIMDDRMNADRKIPRMLEGGR